MATSRTTKIVAMAMSESVQWPICDSQRAPMPTITAPIAAAIA